MRAHGRRNRQQMGTRSRKKAQMTIKGNDRKVPHDAKMVGGLIGETGIEDIQDRIGVILEDASGLHYVELTTYPLGLDCGRVACSRDGTVCWVRATLNNVSMIGSLITSRTCGMMATVALGGMR